MTRKKLFEGYLQPIEKTKRYDVPALERAKAIIDNNPPAHIHVTRLADKVGINEFKLKVGFKELFHTSPYQYRRNLRLLQAKALLEDTDDSVAQIAYKVGFVSYNGFSTAFKKVFKTPPSTYRNRQSP